MTVPAANNNGPTPAPTSPKDWNSPGWSQANLPAVNPLSWEAQLLAAIGAPVTPTNQAIFAAWGQSEGTSGSNNPLAISGMNPGATKCIAQCGTSSPVMAYDNMNDGIAATAKFIKSSPDYSIIIQDLQLSTPNDSLSTAISIAQSVFTNINGSAWCAKCQAGLYPNALHQLINDWGNGIPEDAKAGVTPTSITGIAGDYADAAGSAVSSGFSSLVGPLGSVLGAITSKSFWTRLGFGFMGVAMIAVGLILMLSQTKTGQSVEQGVAMGVAA